MLVLLSASVERFCVSRMRDFFCYESYINVKIVVHNLLSGGASIERGGEQRGYTVWLGIIVSLNFLYICLGFEDVQPQLLPNGHKGWSGCPLHT